MGGGEVSVSYALQAVFPGGCGGKEGVMPPFLIFSHFSSSSSF